MKGEVKMAKVFTIDGGGDKFAYASVKNGKVILFKTFHSPTSIDGLKGQILKVAHGGLKKYDGMGIAIAGVVQNNETIIQSPNLHWLDTINLKEWSQNAFGIKCWVTNDLEAAGIGELKEGELQGVRCGIIDTISTGLGGCTIIRIPGAKEVVIPGEPGHMVNFGLQGPLCGCGKFGCNEARYSGGAIRRRVKQLFGDQIPSGMDPCRFLDQEADKGRPWALQLYKEVGEGIGLGWANTLNRNGWIEKIVYMGKFGVYGMKHMRPHIEEVIQIGAMFSHHKDISIVQSSLWPNGAHIGAAAIFEEHEV